MHAHGSSNFNRSPRKRLKTREIFKNGIFENFEVQLQLQTNLVFLLLLPTRAITLEKKDQR